MMRAFSLAFALMLQEACRPGASEQVARQLIDTWTSFGESYRLSVTYGPGERATAISYEKSGLGECLVGLSLGVAFDPAGAPYLATMAGRTFGCGCVLNNEHWTMMSTLHFVGDRVASNTEEFVYVAEGPPDCDFSKPPVIESSVHEVVEGTWEYDPNARLGRIVHRDASGAMVKEQTFSYDEVGRVVERRLVLQTRDPLEIHWKYAYRSDGLRAEDIVDNIGRSRVHGTYSYEGNTGKRDWIMTGFSPPISGTDTFTFHLGQTSAPLAVDLGGGLARTSYLGELVRRHLIHIVPRWLPFF
jgi:hypothetical protein